MYSLFLRFLVLFITSFSANAGALRVCADPDNLPYSRSDGSGFENRIAELMAKELGRTLAYTWHPQQRAFVRKTFGEKLCDVWMGVPHDFERVLRTKPYYRSAYVFVFKASSRIESFDDPRLKALRIGIQLPGDDFAATPPGHALALRGAVEKVVGFPVFGHEPAAARIVAAIAEGRLDAGVIWGPQGGFYARQKGLEVHRPKAPAELAGMPFEYAIAIGVRRGETALRDALDAALERRRGELQTVLKQYGVPLLEL